MLEHIGPARPVIQHTSGALHMAPPHVTIPVPSVAPGGMIEPASAPLLLPLPEAPPLLLLPPLLLPPLLPLGVPTSGPASAEPGPALPPTPPPQAAMANVPSNAKRSALA